MTEWVRTVWYEDGQQCECSVPKDWIQNQIVNLPGGVKILGKISFLIIFCRFVKHFSIKKNLNFLVLVSK